MTKVTIDRELLPCPFCGDRPELPSGEGTQYEIECSGCGQAMASVQICDLMSLEERAADSFTNYRYADEFVERAKKQAIENWNTRAAPRQSEGEVQPEWVTIEIQRNTINYLNRDIAELREECNTLRQQLAKARDEISQHSNDLALAYMKGGADMRQQRDKLAGLLADVKADYTHAIHWEDLHTTMKRIDAALAEVNR